MASRRPAPPVPAATPAPAPRRATPALGPLTMRCPKCGAQEFSHPDQPGVNSELTCKACGKRTKLSALVQGNVTREVRRLADASRPAIRVTPPIRIGKKG